MIADGGRWPCGNRSAVLSHLLGLILMDVTYVERQWKRML